MARLGLVALATLSMSACALRTYSAKEIEGWVVDAETKQPIEGANVVADWWLKIGKGGRSLVLMEAVTDKNGRFYFPAWGPTEIPSAYPPDARLTNQDPAIRILKIGYRTRALDNELQAWMLDRYQHGPFVRESRWNGKTIELKKFEGDPKAYALSLGMFLTGPSWGRCGWTKIPKTMATLVREGEKLDKARVLHGVPTIKSIEATSEGEPCAGTARQLLGIQ